MDPQSTNKTIAKNTLSLYLRMMVTMVISLYTSRVILQTIGIDDYGIYQAVGGIVGFLSFLNSALATGSSRFLTIALGRKDKGQLRRIFSTVFLVHLALAVLIIILAETVGLWFLYNEMLIPAERMTAAIWVFHISIFTAAINITQVPYTGSITAHERFNLYAYISIIEAVLKLIIVFMLYIGNYDKLILYANLYFVLQVSIQIFYRFYCHSHFEECSVKLTFDRKIFSPIAKFSGWSLIAQTTIALNNQGVLLLLNIFFSPAIVAARAISLQVDGIVKQFVNNFKTASNPQIIKKYAAGDIEGSKHLLLQTSILAYFLILILAVPVACIAEPLLKLWLVEVPDYSIQFLQLIVFANIFGVFDSCFYQAFYASGRLKENALLSPALNLSRFIIVYFCFKNGSSPLVMSYAAIVLNFIISWIAKPLLMIRYFGYKWKDFLDVYSTCIKVAIPTIIISFYAYQYISPLLNSRLIAQVFIIGGISFLSAIISIWYLGLSKSIKRKVIDIVIKKIQIIKN